jgi:hypothetical protein
MFTPSSTRLMLALIPMLLLCLLWERCVLVDPLTCCTLLSVVTG